MNDKEPVDTTANTPPVDPPTTPPDTPLVADKPADDKAATDSASPTSDTPADDASYLDAISKTDSTPEATASTPAAAPAAESLDLGGSLPGPDKNAVKPKKKNIELKLDMQTIRAAGQKIGGQLLRYAPILFFLLIASVYGFLILRINTLSSAQPSQTDIDAQTTTTKIPRIDPNIVKRLENLEDNSQNVQTLFDEARNNPFN